MSYIRISVRVPPIRVSEKPLPAAVPAREFTVVFEDEALLVVDKPSGVAVHGGSGVSFGVIEQLRRQRPEARFLELAHRLDRETSGLIIVAKTDKAHRALAEQFAERTIQKEYLALVGGAPSLLSGSIKSGIGRDPKHRHRMAAFDAEKGGGRPSRTDWVVEQQFGKLASLLRCILHTGRTHQIRVHLKSTGNVILGDAVYGWKPDERLGFTPKRVMLHAEHVVFHHPVSGKEIDLRAPLPKDFKAALKALRQASKASAAKPQRKL